MKVLIVLIDALRPDFLGCYGHPYSDISPIIDEKVARGTLFMQAHGGANTPHGVSMLLTGRRDYDADEWKVSLRNTKNTLPELLPNIYLTSANPIPINLFIEAGLNSSNIIEEVAPANVLTATTVKSLRSLSDDDWLYITWYMDVHEYKLINMYEYPKGHVLDCPYRRRQDDLIKDDILYDGYRDLLRYCQYSCSVKYIDLMLERLFARMSEASIFPDYTIIMADHGEYLKPYYTHGVHWQYQVTHIPLAIIGNNGDGSQSTRRNSICSWVDMCDLSTTLLDLFEVDKPSSWPGVSLRRCLRDA